MNIHQPLAEARHKLRGQNTHEAGEHDQVGLRAVDSARQILIKGFSRRVALVVNQGSFNAGVLCNAETAGAQTIADHQRDLSAQ